jgi:hypothetical protein
MTPNQTFVAIRYRSRHKVDVRFEIIKISVISHYMAFNVCNIAHIQAFLARRIVCAIAAI